MVPSKESDHQRTRWCREQRVWNMHINPKKPLASAHLLFAGIDGNVVKRGDVFARRVFCGKSAIHLFSTIMNSTVRWHPRGAGETGALTEKDPVLCGVRPSPLLGGEAHACLCCQTPVFWLRLLTGSVTEGSDMRSACPEAYTWRLPAGAPPPPPHPSEVFQVPPPLFLWLANTSTLLEETAVWIFDSCVWSDLFFQLWPCCKLWLFAGKNRWSWLALTVNQLTGQD